MNERLLQYIWQFQHFRSVSLLTWENEPLFIIQPGRANSNQGPDFLLARIRVGDTTWAGSIELHIRSSEWKHHGHSDDPHYQNVILHVVWQQDMELELPFPTLVLEDKVPKLLLKKYQDLMNSGGFIPCEKHIGGIDPVSVLAWKERLLIERLEKRSEQVFRYLEKNHQHWEETCWWLIAGNFGITVNRSAFESIARSIPLNIVARHRNQIHQLEALLFGQAGLLENHFSEDYPRMLQKEYRFLKTKYRLKPVHEPVYFLRMRPSNFPTVRLAQLAMLIHEGQHLFTRFRESVSLAELRQLLDHTANDYWHYHYVFDEPTAFKPKQIGKQMTENLLINTVIPLVFAYGHYQDDILLKERAVDWLTGINPEQNAFIRRFVNLGIPVLHAFDSQALLQMKKAYCDEKRCLECPVGDRLLNRKVV
ncbi:MAG: DUF2851 family protein [Chitinophagaceae bacterium]|nr:DUF2851 family protein [Chitinophagaceae bacterium]